MGEKKKNSRVERVVLKRAGIRGSALNCFLWRICQGLLVLF